MSGSGRANRLGNDPKWPHKPTACDDGGEHDWTPVSFVFETQLLDPNGRVLARQPSIDEARVYCVCMKCQTHSYIVTEWAGFYLGDPPSRYSEKELE